MGISRGGLQKETGCMCPTAIRIRMSWGVQLLYRESDGKGVWLFGSSLLALAHRSELGSERQMRGEGG